MSFGHDSFASSKQLVSHIICMRQVSVHTFALGFQRLLQAIWSVPRMDIGACSRTVAIGARAEAGQIFVLDRMDYKRLQLAQMIVRLEIQLLQGSSEAETLLFRDGKRRWIDDLAKGSVQDIALHLLILRIGTDTAGKRGAS